MNRKITLRLIGIGIFHTVLYLYIVPFVIYPKFGNNGLVFVVITAVIISIVIIGTLFLEKKNKRR
jgi:hypothetical protein